MNTDERVETTVATGVPTDTYECVQTILNGLDALVYVSDMVTYELLFMNDYGVAQWGAVAGRKCWQTLQANQQGPCAFCTNALLVDSDGEPTGIHLWEFQNTQDNRWYQCRDQAIRWPDGRLVRIEIAVDITERKAIEESLRQAKRQAEQLAYTDELTGLANRRAFFQLGAQVFSHASREHEPVAVVMFDVDHFKQINDLYGHAAGDEVLRALSSRIALLCRDADVVGRLGGEEFAVILPGASVAQASSLAERLRQSIEAEPFLHHRDVVRCTASFGVAACDRGEESLDALLMRADKALLGAKRSGRNRVAQARAVELVTGSKNS